MCRRCLNTGASPSMSSTLVPCYSTERRLCVIVGSRPKESTFVIFLEDLRLSRCPLLVEFALAALKIALNRWNLTFLVPLVSRIGLRWPQRRQQNGVTLRPPIKGRIPQINGNTRCPLSVDSPRETEAWHSTNKGHRDTHDFKQSFR